MMAEGPTPEQRRQFEILFSPGSFWVVVGPRGSGKTSWFAQIATAIIKWYPNYRVFSNVLLKKKVRLDDGTETFVEYYPERYHRVQSMSEVFHLLPDVIERKETVLLAIDEAMASTGFAAGQTVLSADVRAVTAFSSIIRKLRLCVLLISQTPNLVMKRYREGGFITGWMRRRQGLMPGYGIREVIELVTIDADGNRIGSLVTRTSPTGFATPAPVAKVGDVIFDSAAPAQFSVGEYQKTGKRFNLMAAIAALNVIEEDAAQALREHLANPPVTETTKRRGSIKDVDVERVVDGVKTGKRNRRLTPEEREQLIELIKSGVGHQEIRRITGYGGGKVSYWEKQVREGRV
jgi:energy-coupling factor transporter ATP-binding protein EcfA2